MTHPTKSTAMQSCIEDCKQCHDTCLEMALTHCLPAGGKHVEEDHFRLMINCAEICQTSANFLLSGSTFHADICAICATICDECAQSCEQIADMDECVQACRRCAQSCEQLSQSAGGMGHTRQSVQTTRGINA